MTFLKRHPLLMGLLGLVASFVLAGIIASIGARLFGGMQEYRAALGENRDVMLLWRAVLYGAVAYFWIRYGRPRLLRSVADDKDGGAQARLLLRKLERMVLIALGLIETYNLITWWGA
ncbi:hypothetical protein [Salinicola endophyticus]|uniref:hypothetical protein n=1 Tax=Salinicola endophyticus TaxID=1949083 RepID=UPI000DA152C7|nr:hypothetical protein [Salinicola endophyticus]